MPDYLQTLPGNISQQLSIYLPRIAGSIIILLVGWIVAHLVGRLVRLAASKGGLDKHLAANWGSMKSSSPSGMLGKIAFYLVMLFVLVGFFNTLSLPIVSEPLNKFLTQVFEFAPRVLSAAGLALVAWILAGLVREGSRRGLEAINIDERIAAIGKDVQEIKNVTHRSLSAAAATDFDEADDFDDLVEVEPASLSSSSATLGVVDATPSLSKSIPEAAYWLVLFLFFPAILGVLQMNGILEPIQSMFTKAMGYLPNILGAAIILVVGTFVAKIIRMVVTNLTASFGVNRLADKVGLGEALSNRTLSDILGVVAYAVVLLPILVASLNTLDIDAVTQPAGQMLSKITALIPGLLGAAILLGISYFIGKIISGVVEDLLGGIGFDEMPARLGIASPSSATQSPSKLAGMAILVFVMLLATMQALPMVGLDMLAGHLQEFVEFAIQALLGVAIIALGMYIANLAAKFVRSSGVDQAERLAMLTKVSIIIFAGAIGLQRMGLAPSIVNLAFGTLLGGLGLAAAIAFGWGGRDAAKRLIDRYVP